MSACVPLEDKYVLYVKQLHSVLSNTNTQWMIVTVKTKKSNIHSNIAIIWTKALSLWKVLFISWNKYVRIQR